MTSIAGIWIIEVMGWKYLNLNKGYRVKIDLEDYERVTEHKWHVLTQKNTARLIVATNLKVDGKVKKVTLGKFIMKPPKGKYVYPRRAADELDFRKSNLIVCTMAERQQMLPKRKSDKSTSIYKGVCFDRSRSMWRADIKVGANSVTIGIYGTEEEAALAYNAEARKQFGDLAYQNQVKKKTTRRTTDEKEK